MKTKPPARAPLLIACGTILLVFALKFLPSDFLERQERSTYDLRVRAALHGNPPVATNLGFLYIDENTITAVRQGHFGYKHGLYWPRHVYGRMVDELRQQGARLVAFDVLFGEERPDHSPVQMSEGPDIESDWYLALQMRRAGNVLLATTPSLRPPETFATNALALGDISTERDPDGILRRARPFITYTNWHWAFRRLEAHPGYDVDLRKAVISRSSITIPRADGDIVVPLDSEGQFDITALWEQPAGIGKYARPLETQRVWHMGVLMAAEALGLNLERAEVSPRGVTLRGPNGVARHIPLDSDGAFLIDWCMPPGHAALALVPAHQALWQESERNNGRTNGLADVCRGKIVVIGSSALANDLTDRGATPLREDTLLVSKHWNVANSILLDRFVHRLGTGGEFACVALLGAVAALGTWRFRPAWSSPMVAATAVAYVVLAFVLYSRTRIWLPLVLPLATVLLVHAALLAYRVVFEESERRKVRSVFAKMVSPKIVNELLSSERLALGGAKVEVSVFFADVRGFTDLTVKAQQRAAEFIRENRLEGAAAEACFDEQARATLETVNTYLGAVADVVIAHDGTLDKLIGDCVMAFWGAPTPNPRHALFCVRAAIEAQRAVAKLNAARQQENRRRESGNVRAVGSGQPQLPLLPLLSLGTGVNTGAALAGLMGSAAEQAESLSYTVFGREVNLASRLEGASGHGRIFISEATYRHLQRDDAVLASRCQPREPEHLKGFSEPVPVYEVPWSE